MQDINVVRYISKTRVMIQVNASKVRVDTHASLKTERLGVQDFPGRMANAAEEPAKFMTNIADNQMHSNQTFPVTESLPASSKSVIVKVDTKPRAPVKIIYASSEETETLAGLKLSFHTATLAMIALHMTRRARTT